jgi:prepilin-type N-terminal cleavage/methylation domain-containing protein
MNRSTRIRGSGFTLIEILLVVAAIAILAGIVIIAINPGKQLADTRNAQRRADVLAILNAVNQYSIDHGSLPSSIGDGVGIICRTDFADCTDFIDLAVLTNDEKYLTSIPVDPSNPLGASSGYMIHKTENGRVVVESQYPEQGVLISVTR